MTYEERLRLHLAGKDATWRNDPAGTVASWQAEDGPRAIALLPQPITAAAIVDAYVGRPAGARLTLVHDGPLSPVAIRSAARFGVTLLDAAALPPLPAADTFPRVPPTGILAPSEVPPPTDAVPLGPLLDPESPLAPSPVVVEGDLPWGPLPPVALPVPEPAASLGAPEPVPLLAAPEPTPLLAAHGETPVEGASVSVSVPVEAPASEPEALAPEVGVPVEAAPAPAAPVPLAVEAALPAPAPEVVVTLTTAAPAPATPLVEGPALPWDPAAPVAEPVPTIHVTAGELAALPWHEHAPIEEHVEIISGPPRRPRGHVPRPTVAGAPDAGAWGLPWPRPVASTDALSIADPRIWNAQERVHAMREDLDATRGAGSFGAIKADGSPWLRRMQGMGPG